MPALLQLASITKSFGAVRALSEVSFDLKAGEVHALLGENGAGKSTLIKVITGAHAPDSGTIQILGEEIRHLTPLLARELGVACIYQQPALFPELSVAENIALRLEQANPFHRITWGDRRAHASLLLEQIGANISPEINVCGLSMPEQQLVEIACTVGAKARIILMDEPTASLTEKEQRLLYSVVRGLRKDGAGIIYISHRLEEIFALADRVTVLRDGETAGTRITVETDEPSLIKLMVGREVSRLYPISGIKPAADAVETDRQIVGDAASGHRFDRDARPVATPLETHGEAALSLRNLGCSASGVRGISLEVRAGEVVGLAGLVGAGRTELARTIFGITPADTGEIAVNGRQVKIHSPEQAINQGIAYVPEDRRRHGVILEMAVSANVTMAIHDRVFPGAWLRREAERQLTVDFIREFDIRAAGTDAPCSSLSGGNQQKVALARGLATQPKVLILDEPTQGVDVAAKDEIHRALRKLANGGMAVLMISSDLPEILGLSDRVAVMRGGTIVAQLPGSSPAQEIMAWALGASAKTTPKIQSQFGPEVSPSIPEPQAVPTLNRLPSHEADPSSVRPRRGRELAPYFREISVALALAVLLLALASFAPAFYQFQPLLSLAAREAPALIVACGMALVIICRQIDISVGSQFSVCSVCAGLLAALHWPPACVCGASILLGAVLGAVNGSLVAGLGLPSIVVTLATMVTWREGLRWLRQGVWVDLPEGAQWFGLSQLAGQWTIIAAALALFGLFALAMKHLAAGRFLYAIGSNVEAARLAGIRPQRTTFAVFVLMGALTGLAAMMNLAQSPQVDPNSGSGLELKTIAAVVVGGVAISGGRGNLWGVLTGLVLLACVGPALTHLHVEAYWEKAIQGGVILLAVLSDGLRMRKTTIA